MFIEINRGSSSFNCSLKASLQKQWSSSQSQLYVHVSANHAKMISDGITDSDVEDAAPESFVIDASDTEAIDVE